MNRVVLLDTGPLGMLAHPKATDENRECQDWARDLSRKGVTIVVPEIADYELRRELIRLKSVRGIDRLNALAREYRYVRLSTKVMHIAAELWAKTRAAGRPTAPDLALDADAILGAQALSLARKNRAIGIATTNVGHLVLFADARRWRDIKQ